MADQIRPPWFSQPECSRPGCDGPLCLEPYNPRGWYGPLDATVFCMACGHGFEAGDAVLEQALIAETWMDARERHPCGYNAFAAEESPLAR